MQISLVLSCVGDDVDYSLHEVVVAAPTGSPISCEFVGTNSGSYDQQTKTEYLLVEVPEKSLVFTQEKSNLEEGGSPFSLIPQTAMTEENYEEYEKVVIPQAWAFRMFRDQHLESAMRHVQDLLIKRNNRRLAKSLEVAVFKNMNPKIRADVMEAVGRNLQIILPKDEPKRMCWNAARKTKWEPAAPKPEPVNGYVVQPGWDFRVYSVSELMGEKSTQAA